MWYQTSPSLGRRRPRTRRRSSSTTCTSRSLWAQALPSTSTRSVFTLHPTLFTLHPTPYTLHSAPYTLHSPLYTLHTTLFTLQVGAVYIAPVNAAFKIMWVGFQEPGPKILMFDPEILMFYPRWGPCTWRQLTQHSTSSGRFCARSSNLPRRSPTLLDHPLFLITSTNKA